MIGSFACDETRGIFARRRSRKLPPDIQQTARRKLVYLDAANDLTDLRVPPGNRLEKLAGSLAGVHSIRVNDQWRTIFRWRDGAAFDVQVIDYH